MEKLAYLLCANAFISGNRFDLPKDVTMLYKNVEEVSKRHILNVASLCRSVKFTGFCFFFRLKTWH